MLFRSLGLLPLLDSFNSGLGQEFLVTPDRLHLAGRLAYPNRKRCSPISFTGQGPIDVGFEEVPEATRSDVIWKPSDLGIVLQHHVSESGGTNEPTLARILNQGIFARPPAERIVVNILLLVPQQSPLSEGSGDGSVRILDPSPRIVRSLIREFAIGSDCANQRGALSVSKSRPFGLENFVVDFSECGR